MAGSILAAPATLAGQGGGALPAISVREAVSFGVAAARLAPRAGIGWGPCDRANVPGFDRVAIVPERPFWQWVSDLGVLAVMGGVTVDLTRRDDEARVFAAAAAGVLTAGVTEVLKRVIGRPRPDRYLPDAPAGACSGRSFPSGHTSVAFAFATSYWMARRDLEGEPGVAGWVTLAGAAGVGVSRVAAGRHFPSDVLAGALLGSATGVTIYSVRF